jgi:hypothetical protein
VKPQPKPKKLKIPPPPSGVSRVKRRTSGSGRHGKRCPCGKTSFRTYDGAMGAAHRIIPTDVKRVYWCPESGGFHFTGSPMMSKKQRLDELDPTQEVVDDDS